MKREIIITKDGSPTLYIPELDEHYHSIHGAIQEAQHVFIQNGMNEFSSYDSISILEIGFGSGLNALLTANACLNYSNLHITYIGLEAYPLADQEQLAMDYANQLEGSIIKDLQQKINLAPWDESTQIHANFTLTKIKAKIEDIIFPKANFDIIYFDAFGPRAQPEMWTLPIFTKLYDLLNNNGLFVTYCAKGQVKRDLKSVGFSVESRPGPPGKREMTLAWKRIY